MVSVLTEPNFSNSTWCRKLYDSLIAGLRNRRISYCEISDTCAGNCEGVFVIASDYEWIRSVVRQFNAHGIRPILICNQLEHIADCLYSCVCSDLSASMRNLLNTLRRRSKRRVALYGVNRNSISDMGRVDSLFIWKENNCESIQVFGNDGSLRQCFEAFYPKVNEFDVAVCTNDYAAVSLFRSLQERDPGVLERLEIICCNRTEISEQYPEIIFMDLHFSEYGKEAVRIFERLQKDHNLSCLTSGIVWDFASLENSGWGGKEPEEEQQREAFALQLPHSPDRFYEDPELREMMVADRFLNEADGTDREIIKALLNGASYEKIAEKCFLTEGGVKYRVKKIIQNCRVQSREELLQLLGKYLRSL